MIHFLFPHMLQQLNIFIIARIFYQYSDLLIIIPYETKSNKNRQIFIGNTFNNNYL